MDNKKIGLFIAQERKAKQLTQVDFAEKLYVSAKTVSKWENGNGLPHTDLLLNICSILDITLNELLCGERLSQEMEKIETQKNVLKTVITKRELEFGNINRNIDLCRDHYFYNIDFYFSKNSFANSYYSDFGGYCVGIWNISSS